MFFDLSLKDVLISLRNSERPSKHEGSIYNAKSMSLLLKYMEIYAEEVREKYASIYFYNNCNKRIKHDTIRSSKQKLANVIIHNVFDFDDTVIFIILIRQNYLKACDFVKFDYMR